jgi:hypothetical protein
MQQFKALQHLFSPTFNCTLTSRRHAATYVVVVSLEISSHGHRPAPGPALGHRLLADVSTLQALLQVNLGLAELGQVQGGNLLGLLDLLLVSAYLKILR